MLKSLKINSRGKWAMKLLKKKSLKLLKAERPVYYVVFYVVCESNKNYANKNYAYVVFYVVSLGNVLTKKCQVFNIFT